MNTEKTIEYNLIKTTYRFKIILIVRIFMIRKHLNRISDRSLNNSTEFIFRMQNTIDCLKILSTAMFM